MICFNDFMKFLKMKNSESDDRTSSMETKTADLGRLVKVN